MAKRTVTPKTRTRKDRIPDAPKPAEGAHDVDADAAAATASSKVSVADAPTVADAPARPAPPKKASADKAKLPPPATKPYRMLPHGKFVIDGRRAQPGEVVQLTDAQAIAFKDQFEPA